jgi:hypothetical protein
MSILHLRVLLPATFVATFAGCSSVKAGITDAPLSDAAGDSAQVVVADAEITTDAARVDAGRVDGDAGDSGRSADSGAASGRKRVFVTSATFSPKFAEPNDRTIAAVLERVDARCNQAASAAKLTGKFRAWIGGQFAGINIDPAAHAQAVNGPYEDMIGNVIFSKAKVTAYGVQLAPSVTELGTRLPADSRAWTGEDTSLQCAGVVEGTFMAWATTSGGFGGCGNPTNAGYWFGGFSARCAEQAHVYCFEE